MSECQQRILAGKLLEVSILDETFSFRRMTYRENTTIRWRIEFCILFKWFQNQHTYVIECQQRIAAGKPQKLSILDETLSFRQMTYPENITIR